MRIGTRSECALVYYWFAPVFFFFCFFFEKSAGAVESKKQRPAMFPAALVLLVLSAKSCPILFSIIHFGRETFV